MGFEQCLSDPCVLRLTDAKARKVGIVLAIDVDDMVVVSSEQDCDWLKSTLSETFPVNHLGPLKWYTGRSFDRSKDRRKIKVVQTTFIDKITERFHVTSTSPTPKNILVRSVINFAI